MMLARYDFHDLDRVNFQRGYVTCTGSPIYMLAVILFASCTSCTGAFGTLFVNDQSVFSHVWLQGQKGNTDSFLSSGSGTAEMVEGRCSSYSRLKLTGIEP